MLLLVSLGLHTDLLSRGWFLIGSDPKLAETNYGLASSSKKTQPMSAARLQESNTNSSTNPRSERVFSAQDLWYFKIHEGSEVGPFRYRCEAESNLGQCMAQLKLKLK